VLVTPWRRLGVSLLTLCLAIGALPLSAISALALSPNIAISQVYGGGGNSGAPYTHDFVELFNRGPVPFTFSNWSIQYASGSGTGLFGSSATQITEIVGPVTLAPGQYYLVKEASQAAVGAAFTADHTDPTPIAMAAGAGKVALVNTTTPLGCNGSAISPCSAAALATIIDLVGYGTANFFEGAGPTPAPSNTTSVSRKAVGCTETARTARTSRPAHRTRATRRPRRARVPPIRPPLWS